MERLPEDKAERLHFGGAPSSERRTEGPGMIGLLRMRLEAAERGFGKWASTNGVTILRVTLGLIFVWFGVLKFCPGLCDVEVLAAKTMQALTLGLIPARVCICMLGVLECGIGVGLISRRWMRLTTVCLMLHLGGTFVAMGLFPGETWKHFPYAPTLVGQYILKNLILMAAGLVVGARAFALQKAREPVLVVMPRPIRVSAVAVKAGNQVKEIRSITDFDLFQLSRGRSIDLTPPGWRKPMRARAWNEVRELRAITDRDLFELSRGQSIDLTPLVSVKAS